MAKSENPRRRREVEARKQREAELARQKAFKKAVRRRQIIGVSVVVVVVLAVVATLSLAQNKTSTNAASTTTAPATTTSSTPGNNLPPASLPKVAPGASLTGDTPCPNVDGSSPRTTHFEKAPVNCIDPSGDYNATIHTTKGDITVSLLPSASPQSVNNFVSLALYHYYDGLPITRITPRGWAEIDDPMNADGTKGPGYRTPGETAKDAKGKDIGSIATPLILAMIPDAKGTSGGGLIIGIADQVSGMPPLATQVGNILDSRVDHSPTGDPNKTVQQEIDKAATKSGAPSEVITITGITIENIASGATGTTISTTTTAKAA